MSSTKIPEHLHRPNDSHAAWLLRKIWNRVNRRNMHFMFTIVGQEGMGKSWTAIKMAHAVDPTFDADRVMFDVAGLLKVLKDGDHQPGNFYVLDEAGVQLGRRTWQERGQVLANQALQLVRNHNLGLIFTLPRLSELDSQTQGRLQGFMEIVDKEDGSHVTGKIKFFDPDRADDTGKIYKKYPRRTIGMGGQTACIKRFGFRPPPEELIGPYEERKRKFQEEFYQETIDKLEGNEQSEEPDDSLGPAEVADKILSNGGIDEYLKTANNGREFIDADLIEIDYELSAREAKKTKKLLVRETGKGEG